VVRLGELVAAVDAAYDPTWAEPWDAVGLVCGDPDAEVSRVLLAVDPVAAVVTEALDWGAQLLLTHHPLYLRATTSVAATSAKGRVVHDLIRGGCGLLVVHTNADVARPGVSDALADRLGMKDTQPLAASTTTLDKLVVFVPTTHADPLIDALSAAGAGRLGAYERCAWTATGIGTFTPLPGADPAVGAVGERASVEETRVEMVLQRADRSNVLRAMRAAHPYEEPAYDVLELAALPGDRGLGRVGDLVEPLPLNELRRRLSKSLPATAGGIRSAGDRFQVITRMAVCGGSGGELAGAAAAAGAQAFLTADLRHHTASEALADHGIALIDVAHWATEQPWLAHAARVITDAFGTTVEAKVSTLVTDPWTYRAEPVSWKISTPDA
jgi:dinuclear metal center YbgI/SA1388 family protein